MTGASLTGAMRRPKDDFVALQQTWRARRNSKKKMMAFVMMHAELAVPTTSGGKPNALAEPAAGWCPAQQENFSNFKYVCARTSTPKLSSVFPVIDRVRVVCRPLISGFIRRWLAAASPRPGYLTRKYSGFDHKTAYRVSGAGDRSSRRRTGGGTLRPHVQ